MLTLPPNTEEFVRARLENNEYEEHQFLLVTKFVKAHHRVLEGGAGLGFITNELSKRAAFVVSCEAHQEMYSYACRNAPKAKVAWATLSSTTGVEAHTGSAFGVARGPQEHYSSIHPDNIIEQYNLNAMVLDVEGMEGDILLNVNLEPLELIIVEFHSKLCKDLGKSKFRLITNGFRLKMVILDGDIQHAAYVKG